MMRLNAKKVIKLTKFLKSKLNIELVNDLDRNQNQNLNLPLTKLVIA
jgi:hypothetical protein